MKIKTMSIEIVEIWSSIYYCYKITSDNKLYYLNDKKRAYYRPISYKKWADRKNFSFTSKQEIFDQLSKREIKMYLSTQILKSLED